MRSIELWWAGRIPIAICRSNAGSRGLVASSLQCMRRAVARLAWPSLCFTRLARAAESHPQRQDPAVSARAESDTTHAPRRQ